MDGSRCFCSTRQVERQSRAVKTSLPFAPTTKRLRCSHCRTITKGQDLRSEIWATVEAAVAVGSSSRQNFGWGNQQELCNEDDVGWFVGGGGAGGAARAGVGAGGAGAEGVSRWRCDRDHG